MSTLRLASLREQEARHYGALLGLHAYVQWSWLGGYHGADPQLPTAFRDFRRGLMRLHCYGRQLRALGEQPVGIPVRRLPRHPPTPCPRGAKPTGRRPSFFLDF